MILLLLILLLGPIILGRLAYLYHEQFKQPVPFIVHKGDTLVVVKEIRETIHWRVPTKEEIKTIRTYGRSNKTR